MVADQQRAGGLAPVAGGERLAVLDVIRGLALFGVLMVNLLYFFRISLFQHLLLDQAHPRGIEGAVDTLVAALLEFKAFDLFSWTFGVGLAIQSERVAQRGVSAGAFLTRRLLVLLAFGLAHLLLLSNVDILTLYAVCGLLAIPLLRMPVPLQAAAGLAAIYLPSVLPWGWQMPSEAALQAHVANATHAYRQDGFIALVAFRWQETRILILPLLLLVFQKTFGVMLLGAACWRSGLLCRPEHIRTRLIVVGLITGIIGATSTAAELGLFKNSAWLTEVGSHLPLACAYACVILLWRGSPWAWPIAAAGQMAFTNYAVQSLVFAFVFYGFGLGLFGRVATAPAALGGVVFYLFQLGFSSWWLTHFRFGPLEWLWRSATYGQWQPMSLRRSRSAA